MSALRDANALRQVEWDSAGIANDLDWRMNELAGEAGEACNVLKKIFRERNGIRGTRATLFDLAEELADVIICADLLAMSAGADAFETPTLGGEYQKLTTAGCRLIAAVGRTAIAIDGGDRLSVNSGILRIVEVTYIIARQEGIDLDLFVAKKFNATSTKMGLSTMMLVTDAPAEEAIPVGIYYEASDNTFYNRRGSSMGLDFWRKWRGHNHRFPTDLRTAMMTYKEMGNPQHDAAS